MITQAQSLTVGTITTLISVDFSRCIAFTPTSTPIIRMSANRNGINNIVYAGNTYEYVGFDARGFRSELNGRPPAPTITFDKASLINLSGYTALWDQYTEQTGEDYFDWRGATVEITRVVNLDAAQLVNLQQYVVSQVNKITSTTVEVELAVSLGIDRANSQSIQTLSVNRCGLKYRTWNGSGFDYVPELSGGCPYGNPTTINNWSAVPSFGVIYLTNEDQALDAANRNLDKCSYSVKGCQSRFDPGSTGLALPFRGLYSPVNLGK